MTINDPGGGGCEVQGTVTFQKHEVYSRGDFAENDVGGFRFVMGIGFSIINYLLWGSPTLNHTFWVCLKLWYL